MRGQDDLLRLRNFCECSSHNMDRLRVKMRLRLFDREYDVAAFALADLVLDHGERRQALNTVPFELQLRLGAIVHHYTNITAYRLALVNHDFHVATFANQLFKS